MREFPRRLRLVSLALGAWALVALASTGCVVHHGPYHASISRPVEAPPRVAAHGYVHRYQGVALVFDRSWNGYRVREHPGHYFQAGRYYRWRAGRWEGARRLAGPWVTVERGALPAGLRQRELARLENETRPRGERSRWIEK